MTADFSGRLLPPPPDIHTPFRLSTLLPALSWVSPAVSDRLAALEVDDRHPVVGGRTVWVGEPPFPRGLVVSQPNRYGAGEDLAGLKVLADRWGAKMYVDVDPLLWGEIELPAGAVSLTDWPGVSRESLLAAGARARLAADALERRLRQVPGLEFLVSGPVGRTVTVVLPAPATRVQEALTAAGALVQVDNTWEAMLLITTGWWHTRPQIEGLVAAIGAALRGGPLPMIDPDSFDRVPADLPLRRLGTITPFL